MPDIYIRGAYLSIEKPFSLSTREYSGVEVAYGRIGWLTTEQAQALHKLGVPWWGDEPDWEMHERRIDQMIQEKRIKDAQAVVDDAQAKLSQISTGS